LEQYASVFNSVEGNTTFYSLPSIEAVARWGAAVPTGFQFCFKLPRTITHDKGLRDVGPETAEFLRRVSPLEEKLGPFMIQLPASLGPSSFEDLRRFLKRLPGDFRYAVELRHLAFYREPWAERARQFFDELEIGRVVMDTRALRSGDPEHPDVLAARHTKPDLPLLPHVTGGLPFVRFVGHPHLAINASWLQSWATTLAQWIESGLHPYFFTHCPNDLYAPPLARHLLTSLTKASGADLSRALPDSLPPWPGEEEAPPPEQLRLF